MPQNNQPNYDSLIKMISQKLNMSDDQLKNAVASGNFEEIKSHLSKENTDKFNDLLKNKDQITQSNDINSIIENYFKK